MSPCMIKCCMVICCFDKIAMLERCSVPDWFVNSRAHLRPRIPFVMSRHLTATELSAGISARADDEFLFVRRWKVLQKAAATKSPHRFHEPMPTFVVYRWNSLLLPTSAAGEHQDEDLISVAYWMYPNTEPEIHVSRSLSTCFRMDLPSNCWYFLEGGTISGLFFSLAVIDTVGEAEDERRRAVMWGRRERE